MRPRRPGKDGPTNSPTPPSLPPASSGTSSGAAIRSITRSAMPRQRWKSTGRTASASPCPCWRKPRRRAGSPGSTSTMAAPSAWRDGPSGSSTTPSCPPGAGRTSSTRTSPSTSPSTPPGRTGPGPFPPPIPGPHWMAACGRPCARGAVPSGSCSTPAWPTSRSTSTGRSWPSFPTGGRPFPGTWSPWWSLSRSTRATWPVGTRAATHSRPTRSA